MNARDRRLLRWAALVGLLLLAVAAVLACTGVLHALDYERFADRRMAKLELEAATAASSASASGSASATPTAAAPSSARAAASRAAAPSRAGDAHAAFQPPADDAVPAGEFGDVIRLGRAIFTDTPRAASNYVGNTMRCSSCHLDAGRMADSAPLWAAFVSYPAFRKKTGEVNTFEQRLQGCFEYSMNGSAPPAGDPVLVALQTYAWFLAQGATVDPKIAGRGYPELPRPPQPADAARGARVYAQQCALCHGADGAGQRSADGHTVFPALWGPDSYNWGAGMGRISTAAAFIRANMPLGLAGSLGVQEAWDVARYVVSHERPQDPRWAGSVAATRERFHDASDSMFGQRVGTALLGDSGTPRRRTDRHSAARRP